MGRVFKGDDWKYLYDAQSWRDYRLRYLKLNSRCYSCGERATVVDHLVPHQGDVKLFKKNDNHLPLCEFCHNKVTAMFDRKYRAGNPVDNKIKWMQINRMVKMLTFRVKVIPYE